MGSGSFARVELLYVLGREAPNHDVHGAAERTKLVGLVVKFGESRPMNAVIQLRKLLDEHVAC